MSLRLGFAGGDAFADAVEDEDLESIDRPKRIANMMIGKNGINDSGASTPMRSASQPHWSAATSTPNDAATDSKIALTALIATTMERNARTSGTIITPRPARGTVRKRRAMSMFVVVSPVT